MAHGPPIALATYVDNVYGFGDSGNDAVLLLQDLERALSQRWGLQFKPESCEVLAPLGSPEWDGAGAPSVRGWPLVRVINVLGHRICHTGGVAADVAQTELAAWRHFWAQFGSRTRLREAGVRMRTAVLQRGVWQCVRYRAPRWPPTPSYEARLNRLQRRMLTCMLALPRWPDEDLGVFCRRRAREAGRLQRQLGAWGSAHVELTQTWLAHVSRRPPQHWVRRLLAEQDAAWLQQRRRAQGGDSVLAGRTGTRALPGVVRQRWADAVEAAAVRPRLA